MCEGNRRIYTTQKFDSKILCPTKRAELQQVGHNSL